MNIRYSFHRHRIDIFILSGMDRKENRYMKMKSLLGLKRCLLCAIFAFSIILLIPECLNAQTQSITANGSFTVPHKVTSIDVKAWGAGGTGAGTKSGEKNCGGGGGGGAYVTHSTHGTSPGTVYTIVIGVGGGTVGSGNATSNTRVQQPAGTNIFVAAGGSTTTDKNGALGGASANCLDGGGSSTAGGNGFDCVNVVGGSGGTAAGGGGTGGAGGSSGKNGTGGGAGTPPGGGGGGAGVDDKDNLTGGGGANGQVTFAWTCSHTLTSAVGTNAQTVCINTPITNITYDFVGAYGATISGLPTGVTGSYTSGTVQISGTPSVTAGSPYTYTITPTGSCAGNTATGTITVNALPAVTAGAAPTTVCSGSNVTLTASATPATGPATLLSENFNAGTNSWTKINNSTGGTPANAAWTLRADGYAMNCSGDNTVLHSNDNSQFYLSNSCAQGSGGTTATILESPVMSTVGFTTLSLDFYHYFKFWSGSSAKVDVSTNGTSWTNVATYTSNQGAANPFGLQTISLNSYTGYATFYIRFKYDGTWAWYWAIDNVTVSGNKTIDYTYSWVGNPSGTAGLPSGAGTPSTANASIIANPTQTTNYTATAINPSTGCSGNSSAVAVTVTATGTWLGTTTNAWETAANWCGGVPTSGTAVVIPAGTPNQPVINGTAACASLTINGGTTANTLSISGAYTLTVSGAVTINAPAAAVTNSISVGTGTLTAGSIAINAGSTSGYNSSLTVSTGTVNCSGNIAFSGTAAQAQFAFTGAGTLNIGGNFGTGGTFTASNSTVDYNGTNQSLAATTYHHLILSNNGTKTFGATNATTVTGDLTLSGSVIANSAGTQGIPLAISGNLNLSGTSTLNMLNNTQNITVGGNVSVGANTNFNLQNGSSNSFGGTCTVDGTFTRSVANSSGSFEIGGVTTIKSGGSFTVSTFCTLTFNGLLTVNNGGSYSNSTTDGVVLKGGITKGSSGTFTSGTGVYTFNTASQALYGTLDIPNVTVNGITLTNNNTLTISTALDGSGTLLQATSSTLNIGGTSAISTLDALTHCPNLVEYNGAGQTVKTTTYCNLTLSGSGAKVIGTATDGTLASGILSIAPTGSATASVTNNNVLVGELKFAGIPQIAGTWGYGPGTPPTNKNQTYFANTTGYLNALTDALDHFAISTITSPQTVGTAITGITITAQDASNNTFSSFTGTVVYSGTAGITGTSGSFTNGQLTGVSVTPVTVGANETFIVTSSGESGTSNLFAVNPGAPTGPGSQSFCASDGKIVSDLTSTLSGTSIKWYSASSGGVSYSGTELIVVGSYFASQTVNSCESTARKEVAVTFNPNTWIEGTSTEWSEPTNWSCGHAPLSTEDVSIPNFANDPIIGSTGQGDCKNLYIVAGATLTIESSETSSGSLIMAGTFSGTGTVTYKRWMEGTKWHMVSSPVVGQGIATFLNDNTNNSIATFNSTNGLIQYYGLADYIEENNTWNGYYNKTILTDVWNNMQTVPDGNFTSAKGYEIRRGSNGTVMFTGSPGIPLTKTIIRPVDTKGWNCIGNPFTSALAINSDAGSSNFLFTNSSQLETSFAAAYIWVEASGYTYGGGITYYQAISNSGYSQETGLYPLSTEDFIQAGQGFFVKSQTGGGSVSFTTAMQAHNNVSFKSTRPSWPGVRLIASARDAESFTDVTFYEGMTKGLDVTYDAGLLRGNPDFALYTRLIEDNGVDFSLQCLPDNEYNQLIIPVGLDCKTAGTVTFSIRPVNLPGECKPVLLDKQTGIATDFSVAGAKYTATVAADTRGTGRFYLYTNRIGSGIDEETTAGLLIYNVNRDIRIEGMVSGKADAILYDLSGKAIGNYKLEPSTVNILRPLGIPAGTYLLVVRDGEKSSTGKLVLN